MSWLDRLAKRGSSAPADPVRLGGDSTTEDLILEWLEIHSNEGQEELEAEDRPPSLSPLEPSAPDADSSPPGPVTAADTDEFGDWPTAGPEPTTAPSPDPSADEPITTVLVGFDVPPGEDPTALLEMMVSLEELAAVIFRRGDVTYPAGPAEMLLVCPERSPGEVRELVDRLQRAASPMGKLRAAILNAVGDPRQALGDLEAELAICRRASLDLVDRTSTDAR